MLGHNKRASISKMTISIMFSIIVIVLDFMLIPFLTAVTVNDYQATPFEARGQLLAHRILECFGGEIIDTTLVTNEILQQCYAANENNFDVYPVKVTVQWESENNQIHKKTAQSKNVVDASSQPIEYVVAVNNENKPSLGKIIIEYYLVR